MRLADDAGLETKAGLTILSDPIAPDDVIRLQRTGDPYPWLIINPITGGVVVGDGILAPTTPLSGGGVAALSFPSVVLFGHSYTERFVATTATGTFTGIFDSHKGIAARLQTVLGAPSSRFLNLGISGSFLTDDGTINHGFGAINGGFTRVLQQITPNVPWAAQPIAGEGDIAVLLWGINDVNAYNGLPLFRSSWKSCLEAVMSRLRAVHVFENNDAAVTLGGTGPWTTQTQTTRNSGASSSRASTVGSTVTMAVPAWHTAGMPVACGFVGRPAGLGVLWDFTVDGTPRPDLQLDTRGTSVTAGSIAQVRRITGLSAGAHTIVATISAIDGAGQGEFDYFQIESENAHRPIVVCNTARIPLYTGTGSDAGVADNNAATAEVLAAFPGSVALADIDTPLGRLSANFVDTIHPNTSLGATKVANAVGDAVSALVSLDPASMITPNVDMDSGHFEIPPPVALSSMTQLEVRQAASNVALAQNTMFLIPFEIPQMTLFSFFVRCVAGAGAGSLRYGFYNERNGSVGPLLVDLGLVAVAAATDLAILTSLKFKRPQRVFAAVVAQGGGAGNTAQAVEGAVRALHGRIVYLTGATAPSCCYTQTGVAGALPTTAVPTGGGPLAPQVMLQIGSVG